MQTYVEVIRTRGKESTVVVDGYCRAPGGTVSCQARVAPGILYFLDLLLK